METGTIIKIVVVIAVIIAAILIVRGIVRSVKRTVRNVERQVSRSISNAIVTTNAVKTLAQAADEMPDPKSVGGMTEIFLKDIHKSYPEYHNSDAENAVKTFLTEYLGIKYEGKSGYKQAKIADEANIYVDKQPKGRFSGLKYNGIAIYNYKKTKEYATVTYRVSVGFDYNGRRIETRYEVDYTIQLIDSGVSSVSLKCPNCGGTYSSLKDTECPYCGAGIIRDTVMNWFITNAKEIY